MTNKSSAGGGAGPSTLAVDLVATPSASRRGEMTKPAVHDSYADANPAVQKFLRGVLLQQFNELETSLHNLGLHVSAHTVNRAKNAMGWEMEGNVLEAQKAARGRIGAA